jgi:hypothetical protein
MKRSSGEAGSVLLYLWRSPNSAERKGAGETWLGDLTEMSRFEMSFRLCDETSETVE